MSRVIIAVSNSFSKRFIASDELLNSIEKELKLKTFIVEDRNWIVDHNWLDKQIDKLKRKIYHSIYNYRFLFFEDYHNNIALLEKFILLRDRSNITINLLQLISKLKVVRNLFRIIENWTFIDRSTQRRLCASDILIVTYAVNFFEAKLLYNASKLGVKTVNAVLSWDNIMCKGHFSTLPNYFIAWGNEMRNEIVNKYNFPKDKIYLGGVPHFAESTTSLMNRDFIVFVMSAHRFAPTEIEIIKALHDRLELNDLVMVVRPHPQNIYGAMSSEYIKDQLRLLEKRPGLKVIWPLMTDNTDSLTFKPKDAIEYRATLKRALCVLNSGSTASVEALLLNTPVILTSFDFPNDYPFWYSARRLVNFPHLQKLLMSSGVHVAYSLEDVVRIITKIEYKNTNDYFLKELVENTGSNSIKQITNALENIKSL